MFEKLFSVSVHNSVRATIYFNRICSERVPDVSTSKMDLETINAQQKDAGLRKKVRPAMQLYVPPAQRQRQQKKNEHKNKQLSDCVVKPSMVNESAASNSGVDAEVRLEVQDAPSLLTFNCNDEESEIISGKLEKDCVLSAPLSKDEVSHLNRHIFY